MCLLNKRFRRICFNMTASMLPPLIGLMWISSNRGTHTLGWQHHALSIANNGDELRRLHVCYVRTLRGAAVLVLLNEFFESSEAEWSHDMPRQGFFLSHYSQAGMLSGVGYWRLLPWHLENPSVLQRYGFLCTRRHEIRPSATWNDFVLALPMWFLFAMSLVPGALVLRHWRRKRLRSGRVAAGLCLECGYDLRHSPGRCPECGTQAGKTSSDK
jgi:hypothetical protein